MNDPKNPYQSIVERNSFGLKPPPAPAPVENTAPVQEQKKIMVTGIFREHGVQKACLAVVDTSNGQPKNTYLTLATGEKDAGIEVTEINDKDESVRIKHGFTPMLLTFKDNSFKTSSGGPAPIMLPGMPGGLPGGMPRPAVPVAPAGFTTAQAAPAGFTAAPNPNFPGNVAGTFGVPTSNGMTPEMAARYGVSQPGIPPASGGVSMSIGGNGVQATTIPTRNVRTQTAPAVQAGGDPAVQYLNMAVQKQLAERQGSAMPPLPPVE